jgi:hypothetical protein
MLLKFLQTITEGIWAMVMMSRDARYARFPMLGDSRFAPQHGMDADDAETFVRSNIRRYVRLPPETRGQGHGHLALPTSRGRLMICLRTQLLQCNQMRPGAWRPACASVEMHLAESSTLFRVEVYEKLTKGIRYREFQEEWNNAITRGQSCSTFVSGLFSFKLP